MTYAKFTRIFTVIILFSWNFSYSFSTNLKQRSIEADSSQKWYETASFYEIFPRSFKDSNNDGIGDLQGILQKVDYFKDIGIDAIILHTIFKCENGDSDSITDFYDIEPDLGTLDDLVLLLKTFHNEGIKVVLDFIPNHTSDTHEWFIQSELGDAVYMDYYVWADGANQVPNNWLSVYNDTAWTWSYTRQQYYLHQFASNQPDLNFHNSNVKAEFAAIIKYWLNLGVDGIKIIYVSYLAEDANLTDENYIDDQTFTKGEYGSLQHIYTKDTAETLAVVYDWRVIFDEYNAASGKENKILITEADTNFEKVVLYYENKEAGRKGAHIALNLDLILNFTQDSTAEDLVQIIDTWYSALPLQYPKSWMLGNSNTRRLATRLGTTDGYLMLSAFLQGSSFTYYGDEIGQKNGDLKCSQGRDPVAIQNCAIYDFVSRDFERTPFQWDNSTNAGFNEGATTWLPVNSDYMDINLAVQENKYRSSYKLFKNLSSELHDVLNKLTVRPDAQMKIFSTGNLLSVFLGTKYQCPDVELYAFFFNLDKMTAVLAQFDMYNVIYYQVMLTSSITTYQVGHKFTSGQAYLGPRQSLIIRALCS